MLSNGLFERTTWAGKQPMISENCIITMCLLIFFSPYLIIICSSICLFKDMWENRKGYRGQRIAYYYLAFQSWLQLFVFDEITMKIELFKANAVQISSGHTSLLRSPVRLPPPSPEDSGTPVPQLVEWLVAGKILALWPPCPWDQCDSHSIRIVPIPGYQVLRQVSQMSPALHPFIPHVLALPSSSPPTCTP